MSYVLTKSNEVKLDIWKLVVIFLFALVILRPLLFPNKKKIMHKKITEPFYALPYAMHKNKEEYYPPNSALLFANNKCCKSCCKNLWPLPFDVDDCKTCKNSKEKYVLSNYTCQGENGSGCVCVTKEEADLLDRRGNNKLVGPRIIFPYDGVEPVFHDEVPVDGEGNMSNNMSGEEQEQEQEEQLYTNAGGVNGISSMASDMGNLDGGENNVGLEQFYSLLN